MAPFKQFLLKTTAFEKITAFLSSILAIASAFNISGPTKTLYLLIGSFLIFVILFLFQISRPSFMIRRYRPVMDYLERLAKNADDKIWTVRTHNGAGDDEVRYFKIILERLEHPDPKKRLEDFKRIIRISPNARQHLNYLIDRCSDNNGAEVSFYKGGGPKFDFLIIDERIAVIGFANVGGKNTIGSIVLRDKHAVRGVVNVFHDLWNDEHTELLFSGRPGISDEEKGLLKDKVRLLTQTKQNGIIKPI